MRQIIRCGLAILSVLAFSGVVSAQQSPDVFARKLTFSVDARTIASNGVGTPATLTLTPTSSDVTLTCNDANGCTITMGETGIHDGMLVTITNVSANACTFANTSGVSQLTGAMSMGQWQSLTLQYVTDRWVERARSSTAIGALTLALTGQDFTNGTIKVAAADGSDGEVVGLTVLDTDYNANPRNGMHVGQYGDGTGYVYNGEYASEIDFGQDGTLGIFADTTLHGALTTTKTFTGTADSAGILETITFNNASMTAGEVIAARGIASHTVGILAGANVTLTLTGSDTFPEIVGFPLQVNVNNTTTATAIFGTYMQFAKAGGATITDIYAHWNSDLGGLSATNAYYFWADSQGVYRIREDNVADTASFPQAIPAHYNPRFPKYVAGTPNYERIIDQWVANRAQLGAEKGGTGTLRGVDLLGANISVKSALTPAVSNTSASSCGTTAATIAGNDNVWTITVGATSGTSCTVTFATAFPNASSCFANDAAGVALPVVSTTTTAIVSGTFLAAATLTGGCLGR